MVSVYDSTALLVYFSIVSFLFGSVMGSFLNCAAYRIAHHESFIKGRSKCPSCGHELKVIDLIPLFSWLFLKGKCRYCKNKISAQYFFAELFFALLTVGCLLRFDLTFLCLRNYVFFCCLFCLSLVDLECFIIPNGCLIISVAVWAAYLPFSGMGWKEIGLSVLAGIVYGGGLLLISLVMDKILKKESLGGGDVKLYFVIGLYLGLLGTLFSLIIACIIGLLFALFRKVIKHKDGQIPFGPSIALSAPIMLFFGEFLVNGYLNLFSF